MINFPLKKNEYIKYIEWNPLISLQFLVATNEKIFNCIIFQNIDNLDVKINNSFNINSNLIKILYSKDGNFIIFLYSNYLEIYNSFFEIIYSKIFITKTFIDCGINNSSNLFFINTKDEIFLFNMKNLQFKSYSNFSKQIIKVIFSPNNHLIYIFIESLSNEILFYILYNMNEDNYIFFSKILNINFKYSFYSIFIFYIFLINNIFQYYFIKSNFQI